MGGLFQRVIMEGEGKGRMERGKEKRRKWEMKKELNRKEEKKMIRKLKDRKAMGVDRIPNEVWKYGGRV